MEYQPTSITVDKPFMSQQAFRDFLKLSSEESAPKIGLHELLEVAKVVIRDELVSCGCSENELTGFRIECQVLKGASQELGEVFSVEWKQLPQSEQVTGSNDEVVEQQSEVKLNDNSPISFEFLGKLTERLNEVNSRSQGDQLISNRVNFRENNLSLMSKPGCAEYTDGKIYKAILDDKDKVLKWTHDNNGKMILCDDGTWNFIPIL